MVLLLQEGMFKRKRDMNRTVLVVYAVMHLLSVKSMSYSPRVIWDRRYILQRHLNLIILYRVQAPLPEILQG